MILRFDETYAAYPDFSQIDEFLYLGAMSSWYLSEGKGKQHVDPKSEKEKDRFKRILDAKIEGWIADQQKVKMG